MKTTVTMGWRHCLPCEMAWRDGAATCDVCGGAGVVGVFPERAPYLNESYNGAYLAAAEPA